MDIFLAKFGSKDGSSSSKTNLQTLSAANVQAQRQAAESPPQTSRKRKASSYCRSWEENKHLKGWIVKSDNNLAFCKICKIEIKAIAGISDLKSHGMTSKHLEKAKAIQIHAGSSTVFVETNKWNSKVAKIEIHLAAFCAEHNISFLSMDHLVPLLKNVVEDSELIKKTRCARTKTTALVKCVLGDNHHEELCSLLRSSAFSLCVDESTDISTTKLLSLTVRVKLKSKIYDFFFDLVKVTNCNAIGIYTILINTFLQNEINYKQNLVGFAADGANVMTGAKHSVATLLKKDCPNLIIFKCTCHSFALCANHACSFLPKYVESCARDIYNFIQNSPKRIDLFADLQNLLEFKPRKMLHPSQTRWLSLEATVNQLLSRFEVLKLFFLHEDLDAFDSTQRIVDRLHEPQFELYLMFLKFVLNDINKLNRLFQNESPQIHMLITEVSRLYLKIFCYFVKDEYIYIKQFKTIDLQNSMFLKDVNDIYIGAEVSIALNSTHKLSYNDEKDFRENCLKFFVELCNKLLKKFDFDSEILKSVEILAPHKVIEKKVLSIANLANLLPNVINCENLQELDDEWRELRHIDFQSYNLLEEFNIEIFWETIFNIKRTDGSEAFPFLKKLVSAVLTIPVATANVERIFSQINANKTKIRNKLEIPTLCGILRTKDYLKKNNCDCSSFDVSKTMIQKFYSDIYN